jgi:hypothetical protein
LSAVECDKPFLDIAYGFPVIVMSRGGPFKNLVFFRSTHPSHGDYGKFSENGGIFDEFLVEKNEFRFFFSNFILKIPI